MSVNDDYLAKEALLRKRYFEQNSAELEAQMKLGRSATAITNLQQKLTALEMRVIELKMLEAGQYSPKAHRLLQTSMSEISTSSAMSAFERMEEKVMQIEVESETAKELEEIQIVEFFPSLETEYGGDDELAIMKNQLIKGSSNSTEYVSDDVTDAELD